MSFQFSKPGWWLLFIGAVLLFVVVMVTGVETLRTQSTLAEISQLGGHVSWKSGRLEELRDYLGDSAMRWLSDEVRTVNLEGCNVRDSDFARLKPKLHRFDGLENLILSNTLISDESMAGLAEFGKLRGLNLSATAVTDQGIPKLAPLASSLRSLALADNLVGDKGVAHLAGFIELEYLNLDNTEVSDIGIRKLKRLKKLLDLNVSNTDVTDDGLFDLGKHLPELSVFDD